MSSFGMKRYATVRCWLSVQLQLTWGHDLPIMHFIKYTSIFNFYVIVYLLPIRDASPALVCKYIFLWIKNWIGDNNMARHKLSLKIKKQTGGISCTNHWFDHISYKSLVVFCIWHSLKLGHVIKKSRNKKEKKKT